MASDKSLNKSFAEHTDCCNERCTLKIVAFVVHARIKNQISNITILLKCNFIYEADIVRFSNRMLWCWRVIACKFDAVTNIRDENNDCYNQRNTESNENIFLPSLEHGIRFVCSTYTGFLFFRNISTFCKAICRM